MKFTAAQWRLLEALAAGATLEGRTVGTRSTYWLSLLTLLTLSQPLPPDERNEDAPGLLRAERTFLAGVPIVAAQTGGTEPGAGSTEAERERDGYPPQPATVRALVSSGYLAAGPTTRSRGGAPMSSAQQDRQRFLRNFLLLMPIEQYRPCSLSNCVAPLEWVWSLSVCEGRTRETRFWCHSKEVKARTCVPSNILASRSSSQVSR